MKVCTHWQDSVPILTRGPAPYSARFTPVFYDEVKLFLSPNLPDPQNDVMIYLWAQNYIYCCGGRRVCKWNRGALTVFENSSLKAEDFAVGALEKYAVSSREVIEANLGFMDELEEEALRLIKTTAEQHPDLPIEVNYSGGKDSEVLLHLFRRALPGGRFKVVFNDTRQEFAATYKRVSDVSSRLVSCGIEFSFTDPGIVPVELWRRIGPPNQNHRYCCRVYKFGQPGAKISACGVRASESAKRSKYEKTAKDGKYAGVLQFYPILDWPDLAVWLYILRYGIAVNELYRQGIRRVGCVCCPHASENCEARIDIIDPFAREPYLQAIQDTVLPGFNWKLCFGSGKRMPQPFEVERSAEGNRYTWNAGRQLHREWYKPLQEPLTAAEEQTEAFLPASGESGRFAAMERSIACICCGVCAHECLTGALQIDWKCQRVRVDESRCCHCKACLKKQCIVVKNLRKKPSLDDLLGSED